MSAAKYPEVHVQLSGVDGNAFLILGRVQRKMREAGVSKEEISAFVDEATSGDYDALLATVARWVSIS